MNATRLALLATAGSATLLLGALAFQYLGGLAPCKMCIWQRWPHVIAVLLGAAILMGAPRMGMLLVAAAVLYGAGIGFYHAGVELAWFEGPDTCTSGPIGNVSADQLLDQIMSAPLVRCDEIAWSLGGISMAGWNGLISLGLAGLWILAWIRSGQPSSSASQ